MDTQGRLPAHLDTVLRVIALLFLLWLFLCGVSGIGAAFKAFGKEFATGLVKSVSNPIVGLMIGVLVTSVVQSSSTTTTLIVGLVGSGVLDVPRAVPLIMGANIGTTVTNTLVSLGTLSRGEQFRRTFSAAIVHDVFNVMSVAILLPLELMFGVISRPATVLAGALYGTTLEKPHSPIANHFKTVVSGSLDWLQSTFGVSAGRLMLLVLSILAVIAGLTLIVQLMKGPVLRRTELFFDRFIGRSALLGLAFGAVLTAMVQSSSITTSLLVPLAGTGVITLEQLFPITLGCNIGTTITALLASLSTNRVDGLIIALCHLLFNLWGIVLIFGIVPLRRLALAVTRRVAEVATARKSAAFLYVAAVFFILPGIILGIQKLLGK